MSSSLWQLATVTSKEGATLLSELLDSAAISCFEEKGEKNQWKVEAIFEEKPTLSILQQLTEDIFHAQGLGVPLLSLNELPSTDWLKENRKSFPPLEVGSFYIYGSHIETSPPADKISLKIDASIAFGTGQHATTQGCLIALASLSSHTFKNALDMGSGTAVLAMAMAKLFNVPVLAVDNDQDAVMMSKENIEVNALSSLITSLRSNGFDHPLITEKAPYDLITANILAEPLIYLAPSMAKHTKTESIIILSGLLTSQKEAVLQAYLDQGFKESTHIPRQEWSTLILKRS